MSKFGKILVAVDGSKDSDEAFETAATFGKQLGGQLLVITVLEDPPSVDFEGRPLDDITPALEKRAEDLLMNYAIKGRSKYGMTVETAVWHGDPSKTILEVAQERDADMIALGSRGMSGIEELVLGSVSHDVAKRSKLPILIVK